MFFFPKLLPSFDITNYKQNHKNESCDGRELFRSFVNTYFKAALEFLERSY
jgi:hypothetical protein